MTHGEYGEQVYAAWLASPMIAPEPLRKLIETYQSAESIYRAFFSGEEACLRLISERYRRALRENGSAKSMDFFRRQTEEHRIGAMLIGDGLYPEDLMNISDPPGILFYQGNPGCLAAERRLAMVGSRRASYKGLQAAKEVAKALSGQGVCIVSGLAYGIDAAGHQGCLEGGSPTVAVLGSGLDRIYPTDHTGLHRRILEAGGLVISEFAPGEKPLGWHFPVRNRIISGLGKALIVMEARLRSGSLTTVQWAADQGKDVFVYPGDPAMPDACEGNIQLLREGARFFTQAAHIMEDMNWLDNQAEREENTEGLPEDAAFAAASTEGERKIIAALRPGSLGMEELCEKTGLSAPEIMGSITMLQLRGAVEALPGKRYQLKSRK